MKLWKVLIGRQEIRDGHTDWTPVLTKAPEDEARHAMQIVHGQALDLDWRLDRSNYSGTTSWYSRPFTTEWMILTMKEDGEIEETEETNDPTN